MILKFDKDVVNEWKIDCESFKYCHFVGFLNKLGEKIDYSMPFGLGGHDNNPTTDLFVNYFYIRDKSVFENGVHVFGHDKPLTGLEYEKLICEDYREELKNALENIRKDNDWQRKHSNSISPYDKLDQDLIEFFYNCYQNESFMNGFGKNYYIMNEEEFYHSPYYQNILKKYPKNEGEDDSRYNWRIPAMYQFDFMYWNYKMRIILNFFKDTLVQYLGYHSIERIPRTITTSEIKIYSTFYNYILNDFTIVRIPKMNYDEDRKMYVEYNQSDFLLPDSELRLKDEIQAIKRLVPIKDRAKYYR